MAPARLRDIARYEREFAAECMARHNELREIGGKPGVHFDDTAPSRALSRAAELERAASLDEVA